jgi:nicotinate-nucleotide adenylyltransferase
LSCAETAFDSLDLDVVVFMPAGVPAFKQSKQVSSGGIAMHDAACHLRQPTFMASRFEVDREGITYTAETLQLLRKLYPHNVELYFITGADAIAEIVEWRDAGSIATLAIL